MSIKLPLLYTKNHTAKQVVLEKMNVVFFNMYIYHQHLIDFYMPAPSSSGAKWFRYRVPFFSIP